MVLKSIHKLFQFFLNFNSEHINFPCKIIIIIIKIYLNELNLKMM